MTIRMVSMLAATLTVALGVAACSGGSDRQAPVDPQANPARPTGLSRWTLPAGSGSAQPDLTAAPDGRLLLSWLEQTPGRRTRLQLADYALDNTWGPARTVAIGSSFVVNWADTPHVAATPDGALWAQWLQTLPGTPGGYTTMLSRSRNDGMNWEAPVSPYRDGARVGEHGFAALWAVGKDRLGMAWLDGRNMAAGADPAAGTLLRSAVFDGALQRRHETVVDPLVCDCCQTAAASTDKGTVLVYRGRSKQDIRDIQIARFDGTRWSQARPVAVDGWKILACPVNGPSVAASGNQVVVGWYTAVGDVPAVKLAYSADAGDRFSAPVQLDQGAAVHGRIEVARDAGNAWALWVREDAREQTLWLARFTPDLSRELERVTVARLQGRGRGTGSPRMALRDGAAHIVWTDINAGTTQLHGAIYVAPR